MKNPIQMVALRMLKKKRVAKKALRKGEGSILQLPLLLQQNGQKRILLVASKSVIKNHSLAEFFKLLAAYNLSHTLFTALTPDPTSAQVEAGYQAYLAHHCDCVVAIGGGSVLDCAKVIALRVTNPKKQVSQMTSFVARLKKSAPLYVAPTTAGTGSEVTIYAIITDGNKRKCPITTDRFLPDGIILDPNLAISAPAHVTAAGGMDALTHAIEAYISTYAKSFPEDYNMAPLACKNIFNWLETAYTQPKNLQARMHMAEAAYQAGLAFRRISLGYVHAIAHRLGELYHLPHGLANAIVLPYVLTAYLPTCEKLFSKLYLACGFPSSPLGAAGNARLFIQKIETLNQKLHIPTQVEPLKESDFDVIIKRAQAEARLQGCPVHFSNKRLRAILIEVNYPSPKGNG